MFELVIFDFDDTLLHLGVNWNAVRKDVITLAKKHGIGVDTSQHLIFISNSIAAHLKKDVDDIFEKHEAECIATKSYIPFPEMIGLLKHTKEKGYKLAVVSGNCNSTIELILTELGVLGHFDVICGRDCTDGNKPEPVQILYIMEKLGADRQKTVFVGNSRFDELAATAAGVSYFKVRDPAKDAEKIKEMLESH